MDALQLTLTPQLINSIYVALIPQEVSARLPSRGQVAIELYAHGRSQIVVLEPDGTFGHWLNITNQLQETLKIDPTQSFSCEMQVTKKWPEPNMPADFETALLTAPQVVQDKWNTITPMARWEWIRWISATASSSTRQIRIQKSLAKLEGKHRRPCCFNLAACTVPEVSKNGILIAVK